MTERQLNVCEALKETFNKPIYLSADKFLNLVNQEYEHHDDYILRKLVDMMVNTQQLDAEEHSQAMFNVLCEFRLIKRMSDL